MSGIDPGPACAVEQTGPGSILLTLEVNRDSGMGC